MYNRSENVVKNNNAINNFIEGVDIYNSSLLYKLNSVEKISYIIPEGFQYRPDLIAKELYGNERLQGYVLIQSGLSLDQLKQGTKLELANLNTLKSLIDGI